MQLLWVERGLRLRKLMFKSMAPTPAMHQRENLYGLSTGETVEWTRELGKPRRRLPPLAGHRAGIRPPNRPLVVR